MKHLETAFRLASLLSLGCSILSAATPAQARGLSLEQRTAAQKAIEQVYWNHRIWPTQNPQPKPTLSAVLTDAAIRSRVEDYLKKSNALERLWGHPVTPEQLQAELDRMSWRSQSPDTLRELYDALGNDPYLIAETLGRQVLVDRAIRRSYATDMRFHGDLKAKAERALGACTRIDCMATLGGEYRETTWKLRDAGSDATADPRSDHAVLLDPDEWTTQRARWATLLGGDAASLPTGRLSGVEDTPEAFVVTAVRSQRHGEITTATVAWPKRSFDSWWSAERVGTSAEIVEHDAAYSIAAPSSGACVNDTWADTEDEPAGRTGCAALWTGSEMIIWGGRNDGAGPNSFFIVKTGSRYNPATDSWTTMSEIGAYPSTMSVVPAVWTGTEMIVWGGHTGGRYNPSTDTWSSTSIDANTPNAASSSVVWTGTEMMVWGGQSGIVFVNTGGRYNPSTNSWLPTSTGANVPSGRHDAVALWTGSEVIIYGGQVPNVYLTSGARYNPSTDTWTTMSPPPIRVTQPAVWTGSQMIIWGNPDGDSRGARYDPSTNTWSLTSPGPTPRNSHSLVWTGTEAIVWAGGLGQGAMVNNGSRYNPGTNSWTPTSTGANVPSARGGHAAVWTGTEMIVWGGHTFASNDVFLNTGGRYNPSTNSWISTFVTPNTPSRRRESVGVWTGAEMIVWGGTGSSGGPLNTGGRYNLATASWAPTSLANVPEGRAGASVVWTGTEMIIWSGSNSYTGGRYNPTTDSWLPTPQGQTARDGHTAVWTGTEMIVWGGYDGLDQNTGARYDPATDTWVFTSVGANVPPGRRGHSAVWTGTEMIVWGGTNANVYGNTGGRYNPSTDTWIATSTGTGVPSARATHTAVWTGDRMIVWGGGNPNVFNTGGRYDPATDSWAATSTSAGVPVARKNHRAVWTGAEMIVWGGTTTAVNFNTGGRYDPSSDSWLSTSLGPNLPIERYGHTAVWTGTQMAVWGGDVIALNPGLYCACPAGMIVYRDVDADGYGVGSVSIPSCNGSIPAGYSANATDCNDADGSVHPGAAETCNGVDDDCSGVVDNGGAALCGDGEVCTDDLCGGVGGCSHLFNTGPCDDGLLCTNGDTCSAGTCSGVAGPPPEIGGVSAAGHNTTTLSWTGLGGGTTYDLMTSTLADLRIQATSGATCLANDVPQTSFVDTQSNPAGGAGYYYLIRAQNVCGNGGYGSDSSGNPRTPVAPCP